MSGMFHDLGERGKVRDVVLQDIKPLLNDQ